MTSDIELKNAVLDELAWEPSVDAAHIGVTAHAGVITLAGHVDNYAQKWIAEKAASRVRGVKAVAEGIKVQLSPALKRSDEDVAAAAVERLNWSSMIPADAVHLKVEDGWVTLTGDVAWHFVKDAAEHDVRALSGVVGISNNIQVRPKINASSVKADIEKALHRSWYYDPDTINVQANGGKIVLSGKVTSWNERRLAGSTAWSAPGATSVENNINVNY